MSPYWPEGQPIAVAGAEPERLDWQGRIHSVERISDHWRVHTNWWQREVWRDYWEVVTDTGLWCVIYQDLLAHTWLLERIYE
ncbi:MAG: hypothetical protein ACUVX9_17680 [Anaerolineae bacterium]